MRRCVKPLLANEITTEQAFERSSDPLRDFMLKNVREKDLKLFVDMSHEAVPASPLTFFVLVDGWSLVTGSLVQSYGT